MPGGNGGGGQDPSSGAGLASLGAILPGFQQAYQRAQQQKQQRLQFQQGQTAEAQGDATLRSIYAPSAAGGASPGGQQPQALPPGASTPPPVQQTPGMPQIVPPGQGSKPGGLPMQGPMPQVGGGGREGGSQGGAQYGPPPAPAPRPQPTAPASQVMKAPLPQQGPLPMNQDNPQGRAQPSMASGATQDSPFGRAQPPAPAPAPAPAPPPPVANPLMRPRGDHGKGGGNVDSQLNIAMDALKAGESPDGRRGPTITKGRYKGERAIGDYQIMPGNVAQWTKEALGKSMTPEEFAADKGAQEKTARYKMSEYYKATGSWRDAASIWHSGKTEAEARAAGSTDGYTTTGNYVDKFSKNMARAAKGDLKAVEGVSQTPEGKAALAQAKDGNLDIRSVVRAFIASNPNAKPGDMIRAMKELQPFMNMDSQAQARKLQEEWHEETIKERVSHDRATEQQANDNAADRKIHQEEIERDKQASRDAAAQRDKEKVEADKEKKETKAQELKDKEDKEYREDLNGLATRITGKETALANLGSGDQELSKNMKEELKELNAAYKALKAEGKPSTRSAGKGRDQGDKSAKKPPLPESTKKELQGLDYSDPKVKDYIKHLGEQYDLGS